MIKKRILIVDDEAAVLKGMERVLRPMQAEWSISCVSGGKEALTAMQQRRFDVIVSDVQMPEMTGAELLAKVREEYPSILRVILSGDIGNSLEGRGLNVAHQVLTKPCSSESLVEAIRRAYSLRRQSEANARRHLVAALKLPIDLEDVGSRVRALVAGDDEVTTAHLVKRVSNDSELYGRMLGAFGKCETEDIEAQELVDTFGDVATFAVIVLQYLEINWGPRACPEYPLKTLWHRCGSMARQTALITRLEGAEENVSEAFAAGLLHCVGQLLVAVGKPEEYQEVLVAASGSDDSLPNEERTRLGVESETIAGWYLEKWGFPERVCEAVAFQRHPGENAPSHRLPLAPLHVARTLTYSQSAEARDVVDREFLESAEVVDRLADWTQLISGGDPQLDEQLRGRGS